MNHPLLIHKKILQWRWYKDCAVSKFFLHALLTAKIEKEFENGQFVDRGELHTSLRTLVEETGLSLNQIRGAMKKLCKTGEIEVKSNKKFTLIKILNFDHYQQSKPSKLNTTVFQGSNQSYLNECINDQYYIETIAMRKKISVDLAKEFLRQFKSHLDITDDKKSSKRQFTSHFGNWLNHQNIRSAKGNAEKTHMYSWRGVPEKRGTKEEYEKDKRNYDHVGFDFKLIKML